MKIIEVSDEMHEFLMDLSKELNSQNHRGTRMPYFFQIREQKETADPEGCGEEVWVCDGEICLRDDEDIKEAVFEHEEWDLKDAGAIEAFEELDQWDIEDILKENYTKHSVVTISEYSNAFFTAKAAFEHIEINGHNLCEPDTYLQGAYRNKEMETLMQFLCELNGGKLHT